MGAPAVVVALHLREEEILFPVERERRRRRGELEQLHVSETHGRRARNRGRARRGRLVDVTFRGDLHFQALDPRLQPPEQQQAFGAHCAGAEHARLPDVPAVLAQVRQVQGLRRQRLPGKDPRPGEIPERRSAGEQLRGFRQVARRARSRIGDDPICGVHDALEQIPVRTAAPDHDHGQVGTEQPHHRRLQVPHRAPRRSQHHPLHRDCAARAHHRHAGGQRLLLDHLVGHQREQPARMQGPGNLQRFARALVLRRVEEDGDEVQRGDRLRSRAAALARLPEQHLDPPDIDRLVEADRQLAAVRRRARRDGLAISLAHSRLHALQSCTRSSSAASGPQVPAGYG